MHESHGHSEVQDMEIQIRRHPEKDGETILDPEGKKLALPVEGIQQTQSEAVNFAESIKDAPDNVVVWGYTSNQPRTQEADYIFGQELRVLLKQLPDAKIFDQKVEGSLEEIAEKVGTDDGKVIIINSLPDKALGIRPGWNMEYVAEETKKIGQTEFVTRWLDDQEMQEKSGIKPEEVAKEFQDWIVELRDTAQKLFPGRPVIITGFGHDAELNVGIMALMGKEISSGSLAELGGSIETMEEAKVEISPDGHGNIIYRGKEVPLVLDQGRVNEEKIDPEIAKKEIMELLTRIAISGRLGRLVDIVESDGFPEKILDDEEIQEAIKREIVSGVDLGNKRHDFDKILAILHIPFDFMDSEEITRAAKDRAVYAVRQGFAEDYEGIVADYNIDHNFTRTPEVQGAANEAAIRCIASGNLMGAEKVITAFGLPDNFHETTEALEASRRGIIHTLRFGMFDRFVALKDKYDIPDSYIQSDEVISAARYGVEHKNIGSKDDMRNEISDYFHLNDSPV